MAMGIKCDCLVENVFTTFIVHRRFTSLAGSEFRAEDGREDGETDIRLGQPKWQVPTIRASDILSLSWLLAEPVL